MKRKDQYKKYLKSPEWRLQREIALDRTDGFCQFCGDFATQVHHASYPKQFGEEHPNSLIPVCNRCHSIAHGVQEMKTLTDAVRMSDLAPDGIQLKYLLSDGRVYASAKSWSRALQVPKEMKIWFETGLARTAKLKSDLAGGNLEMSYLDTPVYRWHAVAEQLRVFDRKWYQDEYKARPKEEQSRIRKFHENYERLVSWGYDLQERALSSVLNPATPSSTPVTQDNLLEAIKEAVAPRLRDHDGKLREHDVVISEIKESVPALRDQEEFITIKQGISEQGLDHTSMPLYPRSRENLSGLAGQILATRRAEKGPPVIARMDGHSKDVEVNTYRRREIYAVLFEIRSNSQSSLFK